MNEPTDRAGEAGEINQKMELWCDKHHAPFLAKNCNGHALVAGMMDAFISTVSIPDKIEGKEPPAEAVANAVLRAMKPLPICCMIGQEKLDALLARVPASTGNTQKDEEITRMLFPGFGRERLYPREPGTYTRSTEGGKDYYMMLGNPEARDKGNVKKGEMVCLVSEGHPNHPRGPEDVCTMLAAGKVSSVKEAREFFRKELDAKDWLQEDAPKQ